MITDQATGTGLLEAIIAEPESDDLRLIYADWLEENGDRVRAAFIRVQVRIAALESTCLCGSCVRRRGGGQHTNGPCAVDQERDVLPDGSSRQAFLRRRERELLFCQPAAGAWHWHGFPADLRVSGGMEHGPGVHSYGQHANVWRRGFVAEITTTLADWYGGRCHACMEPGEDVPHPRCRLCAGSGHTPGHGPALVRACPLERVTLSDREPNLVDGGGPCGRCGGDKWVWDEAYPGDGTTRTCPDCHGTGLYWPTRAAALDALSTACLAWAHSQDPARSGIIAGHEPRPHHPPGSPR